MIFREIVNHIVRIARICMLERGHMMLIGLQGMGKRSLADLTSIVIGAKFQ